MLVQWTAMIWWRTRQVGTISVNPLGKNRQTQMYVNEWQLRLSTHVARTTDYHGRQRQIQLCGAHRSLPPRQA
jgi:hypothetical protein